MSQCGPELLDLPVFAFVLSGTAVSNLSLIKEIIPTTISDDANSEAATSLFQDEKRDKSMEVTAAGRTLTGSLCSSQRINLEVITDLNTSADLPATFINARNKSS
jgi:hypothetical protein